MKKALVAGALALVGLLVVPGVVPAAHAYPEFQFEAEVSKTIVVEGEKFTATSKANVECSWTHAWRGKAQRSNGKSYTSSWRAPQVKKETTYPLDFTCEYDGSVTAGRAVMVPAETATRTINVTVVPRDAVGTPSGAAALPNTGGPSKYILVGGLLLLVLGFVAATAARRRGEGVDAL